MFLSEDRQKLIEDNRLKDKAKPQISGEAEGVTLGFNTGEKPLSKKEEILYRKF